MTRPPDALTAAYLGGTTITLGGTAQGGAVHLDLSPSAALALMASLATALAQQVRPHVSDRLDHRPVCPAVPSTAIDAGPGRVGLYGE